MLGVTSDLADVERRGSGLDDAWLSDFLDEGYKTCERTEHKKMELDFSAADNVNRKISTDSTEKSGAFNPSSEQEENTLMLPKSPAALAQSIRNSEMERYIQESLSFHNHHHRHDGHRG